MHAAWAWSLQAEIIEGEKTTKTQMMEFTYVVWIRQGSYTVDVSINGTMMVQLWMAK